MKPFAIILIVVAAVAALGWRMAAPGVRRAGAAAVPAVPPTTTKTDPAEVFQRAFWKRPGEKDRILHAERREWADSNGISHWQWFIAVQPSPELTRHLRDDNAFNLVASASPGHIDNAPAWFVFDAGRVTTLRSPQGSMRLLFDEKARTLYATDSGGGFQPGAPEPARPALQTTTVTAPPTAGRLPTTPPPKP